MKNHWKTIPWPWKLLLFLLLAAFLAFSLYRLWYSQHYPGYRQILAETEELIAVDWGQVEEAALLQFDLVEDPAACFRSPEALEALAAVWQTMTVTKPYRQPALLVGGNTYRLTLRLTDGTVREIAIGDLSYHEETGLSTVRIFPSTTEDPEYPVVYALAEVTGLRALMKDPAWRISHEAYNALDWAEPVPWGNPEA